MEKQNITLSLPKNILTRLKHIAVDRNTSISGLVTQALEDIVRKEETYQIAKSRQLMMMEKGVEMGYINKDWKREELHER